MANKDFIYRRISTVGSAYTTNHQ